MHCLAMAGRRRYDGYMAFKKFGPVPYPPLSVVDRDEPVDEAWLAEQLVAAQGGVSLLLRSDDGANQRGGFFFHISLSENSVSFHDFSGLQLVSLPLAEAAKLINHASGRAYNEDMLTLCQRTINLRQDL